MSLNPYPQEALHIFRLASFVDRKKEFEESDSGSGSGFIHDKCTTPICTVPGREEERNENPYKVSYG